MAITPPYDPYRDDSDGDEEQDEDEADDRLAHQTSHKLAVFDRIVKLIIVLRRK